jgi:hypothetical protein
MLNELYVSREQVKNKAFNWIHGNINNFDLSLDPYKPRKDFDYLKSIAELSLLCALYKRQFGTIDDERINGFKSWISNNLLTANYVDRILRAPELLLPYTMIYASLRECGVEPTHFKETLKKMLGQGYCIAREMQPFRRMDLFYVLGKSNLTNSRSRSLESLYRETVLYKIPSVLFLELSDVYAITHIIFYLSDFGFKKITTMSHKDKQLIHWSLANLIGIYLHKRNWDILSELLLSCHCLHWYPYPIYKCAWECLLNSQRSDGSIPGPCYYSEMSQRMGPEEAKNYFINNYHSTLIAAIACFLTNRYDSYTEERTFYECKFTCNLPFNRCHLVMDIAHKWLRNIYDSLTRDRCDLSSILYLLLGDWIYKTYRKQYSHDNKLRYSLKDKIDSISFSYPDDLFRYDIKLILLSNNILCKSNLRSDNLRKFANAYHELLSSNNLMRGEEVELLPVWFLLHKTDLLNSCLQSKSTSNFFNNVDNLYVQNITEISKYIEALTLFGKLKLMLQKHLSDHFSTIISTSTINSLRDYNLPLGLALMRTMRYINIHKTLAFKQTLNFIIWQQRHDGSFGYLAPEVSRLREADSNNDQVLSLYLPLTVSAMWTIAEAVEPRFLLYNSTLQ